MHSCTCDVCGTAFLSRLRSGKYCGRTCANRAYRTQRKADGRWQEYRRRPEVAARERAANYDRLPRAEVACSVCGDRVRRFTVKDGRRPTCSHMCRVYLRSRCWPARRVPASHPSRASHRPCAWCGASVVVPAGREWRYCGAPCRARAHSQRKESAQRAWLTARVEYVDRWAVLVRDEFMCRLCDEPLATRREIPHPLAPTLDHVVPLAQGGDNTEPNLQAAHFICNVLKSDARAGGRRDVQVLVATGGSHAA